MKQKLTLFAVLMMALAIPQSVKAYDFSAVAPSGQTLYYNIIGSDVTVVYPGSNSYNPYVGYTNPTGSLEIPSFVTYNNTTYSVTSIGEEAFNDCSGLTSVTIPNSVTSIGNGAFYHCIYITSVTIGNSVTSIGNYAFYFCCGLTSVTIPNSVTVIGDGAFQYCSGLTSVTIPNSVTSIGDGAFLYCSSLASVTIPNSVTSIGDGAFNDIRHIEYYGNATGAPWGALTMNGFTEGDLVYSSNTKDTLIAFIGTGSNVTIPNSVTSIGDWAFYHCSGLTEITSLATTPPTFGWYTFFGVSSTIPIHIPCGSMASYQTAWSPCFCNFIVIPFPYSINVGVANSTFGVSNITEGPNCDSTVVIKATAFYGYHFTQWNDGNTNNPRTITLTQDTSFTAHFAPNQYTLTVTAGEHGTASGSGTYDYGDTITIQAYPEAHYHFTRWNDGNTDNPRQYRIEGDRILTAFFAIDTHTVTVVSNDIVRGMAQASGTEFAYGTPCTVTATAYTGYTFVGWSNGVIANPYTFAVMSDVALTALFVEEGEEVYMVTVVSADPTMGSVSGGGQALRGGIVTISATPNEGYRFLRWNDGNTENPRAVTVMGNITYTAYFESTTQGVSTVDASEISIYTTERRIVVRGAEGMEMTVFDVMGREVVRLTRSGETPMLPQGVYLIKVGNHPARRVVVVR